MWALINPIRVISKGKGRRKREKGKGKGGGERKRGGGVIYTLKGMAKSSTRPKRAGVCAAIRAAGEAFSLRGRAAASGVCAANRIPF